MTAWMAENWFGVLGIAIGVAVSAFTVWWQRQPKTLDYEIVSSVALVNSDVAGLSGKLEVVYDGVPMTRPHVTTITIVNSGKVAVRAVDYVEPIAIEAEQGLVLDGRVVGQSSPGVFDGVIFPDDESPAVGMTPALLNAKDWFTILLVSEGPLTRIRVSARFADQKRPMRELRYDVLTQSFLGTLKASTAIAAAPVVGASLWKP